MNTKLRLMSIASLLIIAVTGCTDTGATLSDEKLTEEEIWSIMEGTDSRAIIYEPNKMLFIYSSSDGCVEHPESVAVEGNNLKVTFSEPEPDQICTLAVEGPFAKVINLPNGFVDKTDYKVTVITDRGRRDIPIVVK